MNDSKTCIETPANSRTVQTKRKVNPLFETGKLVVSRDASTYLSPEVVDAFLKRHVRADWGSVGHEGREANDDALRNGGRLLSVYCDPDWEMTCYVVTEADRSQTTIMFAYEVVTANNQPASTGWSTKRRTPSLFPVTVQVFEEVSPSAKQCFSQHAPWLWSQRARAVPAKPSRLLLFRRFPAPAERVASKRYPPNPPNGGSGGCSVFRFPPGPGFFASGL